MMADSRETIFYVARQFVHKNLDVACRTYHRACTQSKRSGIPFITENHLEVVAYSIELVDLLP